jgi:hypothetical protein
MGRAERPTDVPVWLGVPRYLFGEMLRQTAVLSKGVMTLRGETIFRARWDLNVLRGQILEAYHSGGEKTDSAS